MNTWTKAVAVGLGAPLAVALFVLAFMWPMATQTPKDVPLAIVGNAQQVEQVTAAFESTKPGLFDITTVDTREGAITLIEQREVSGAVVLGPSPELLTAPAAGTAHNAIISNLRAPLQEMAAKAAAAMPVPAGARPADAQPANTQPANTQPAGAPTVTVTEVAPLSASDASGMVLNMSVIPIAMGGIIGAALTSFALRSNAQRLVALLVYTPLAGALVTGLVGGAFDLLPGSFWSVAGVYALGIGAVSCLVVGLRSLIGKAGFALGALFVMLLSNPLAGTLAPKEFIAGGWGYVGQYLPIGAAVDLLRSVNYFPQASIAHNVWTLAGYVFAGLLLLGIGAARQRKLMS
ncbi:hypothetical protein G7Y31_11445 [Corynebacterium lizhenjunii]|uniref:ABC-2 type transporter transmembrane domain-containing protein n=1 Tax=Corynebacterium lizhenjunii TaxID=2709394 RepID=A0A7T0KE32_9CORY|nr:ABC transporter permease [Corynebacterium lizhenjunii]QPK79086.1 hypothetical protein G7Y31_11445 [Corynebacterium lizhenjunii]